jgi:hypothetical protein
MSYLVDLVLIAHASFALFTITGGFLALRWHGLVWPHLPCVFWGSAIEFGGWVCPLTPLENRLRAAAGQATYSGDFLAHYLGSVLYPIGLTRATQISLGTLLVAGNAIAYSLLWRQHRAHAGARWPPAPRGR